MKYLHWIILKHFISIIPIRDKIPKAITVPYKANEYVRL